MALVKREEESSSSGPSFFEGREDCQTLDNELPCSSRRVKTVLVMYTKVKKDI